MKVQALSDSDFEQATREGTVLVDFYASWCGPCQLQSPVLDTLASELDGEVRIYKLDVDRNPQTPQRFGVQSIPYLVLMRDGEVVQQFLGLQSDATLRAAIRAARAGEEVR